MPMASCTIKLRLIDAFSRSLTRNEKAPPLRVVNSDKNETADVLRSKTDAKTPASEIKSGCSDKDAGTSRPDEPRCASYIRPPWQSRPRPGHSTTLAPVAIDRRRGILDSLGGVVPTDRKAASEGIAGADGRQQLDVEGAVGKPDMLAVGEVHRRHRGSAAFLAPLACSSAIAPLDGLVVATAHLNAKRCRAARRRWA